MKRGILIHLLQGVVIGCVAMVLLLCAYLVPWAMDFIAQEAPRLAPLKTWVCAYFWVLAVPIGAALALAWRIFGDIGHESTFTEANAKRLLWIFRCALVEFVLLVGGVIVAVCSGASHPFLVISSVFVCFLCGAAAVACLVLSHLVGQAAQLQQENDLTI